MYKKELAQKGVTYTEEACASFWYNILEHASPS